MRKLILNSVFILFAFVSFGQSDSIDMSQKEKVNNTVEESSSQLTGKDESSDSKESSDNIPKEITEASSEAGDAAKEHFDNIFEILSPSRILTIIFVLFITWLFMKGLSWLIKRTAKRFVSYRLVILRLIPIFNVCLLYTSPSPRDRQKSRMPSSA